MDLLSSLFRVIVGLAKMGTHSRNSYTSRLIHPNYRLVLPQNTKWLSSPQDTKDRRSIEHHGGQEKRSILYLLCGTHSLLPGLSHQTLMSKVAEVSLCPFRCKENEISESSSPTEPHTPNSSVFSSYRISFYRSQRPSPSPMSADERTGALQCTS